MVVPEAAQRGGVSVSQKTALIVAAALTISLMVSVTVLLALHVSTTSIVSVMSVLILPTMTALLYGKQAETSAKVDQVQQQTNGNTTELQAMVKDVLEHLKSHASIPTANVTLKTPVSVTDATDNTSTPETDESKEP